MKTLLITNDLLLIEQYKNSLDIENSIIMGISKADAYNYLIIDEKNLKMEKSNLNLLEPHLSKIAIIGQTSYKECITITKNDLEENYIDELFKKEPLTINTQEETMSMKEYIDEMLLLKYMEQIAENPKSKDLALDLSNESIQFRNRLYEIIPSRLKKNLFKISNNSIKKEYAQHLYQKKFNSFIAAFKALTHKTINKESQ